MKRGLLCFSLLILSFQKIHGQTQKPGESTSAFKADSIHEHQVPGYKTKLFPSMIVPGILIGYGLTTLGNHGLYSSRQARVDLLRLTAGKGSSIDNYMVVSPYVEFGALLLLKVNCKNDVINTALLIAKTEVIMNVIVQVTKYTVREERPYSYGLAQKGVSLADRQKDPQAFVSMPSSHTANAFAAATIVYREFRYRSPWYGIGAFTLATSVAAFRMINDQHWESDVLVGAGIGMLSANVVYATHLHRWGRKEVCMVPVTDGLYKGLTMSCVF